MENNNKKSTGTVALIVLLLIITIVALVFATYAWAKYTERSTGTASANVAKWNVTLDSATKDFAGTHTHVVSDKIAPGTSGSFAIQINPGDSEVCMAYQIKLTNVTFSPSGQIKHLKFFADSDHTSEIKMNEVNGDLTGFVDLTGHNTAPGTTVTKTIYWIWPYDFEEANSIAAFNNLEPNAEAYDQEDNNVGKSITSMSVTYEVRAWQVDPGTSNGADNTNSTNKPE